MKLLTSIFLFVLSLNSFAQDQKPAIYNPTANAKEDINFAVSKAAAEGKHIILQIGGNWCPWCIKLHKFIHENYAIDSIIKTDYVYVLVNYSKDNKNPEIMQQLDFPQRFGFPVLVVLDEQGRRIHTQDTGLLEEGDGYSAKKITQFLLSWNKAALNPEQYK
jgi:thioredoxin-related protein